MATTDYKEKYEKAVQAAMLAKQDTESAVTVQTLEEIFPELKESEDDRVKNEIISAIKEDWPGHTDWIAWLEKQGEHANFLSKIQAGDKVTRNEDGVLVNLSQLNRVAKKQGEQKPQRMVSAEAKETMYGKPAWSEEDEVALGNALWCCKQAASIAKDENDMGNIWYAERWLKSLKERVQQQPKWSDEDKDKYEAIVAIIRQKYDGTNIEEKKYYNTLINWLKSLRPQNKWKPSDEQMDALLYVVRNYTPGVTERIAWESIKTLELMFKDLKKLKG